MWGVGRQYRELLRRNGIRTARELRDAPDTWVRRNMTITGLRTVWELRGVPCIPLDELPAPKKGIVSSRSFGRPVERLDELREAVAAYAGRAAEKLRAQGSVGRLHDRVHLDQPVQGEPTRSIPTASPAACRCRRRTRRASSRWRSACWSGFTGEGYRYKKAGVMLYEIMPEGDAQLDLFSRFHDTDRGRRLMRTVDGLNRAMGRHTLRFAAEGIVKPWQMRRAFLSGRFTTHWDEIPVVRA